MEGVQTERRDCASQVAGAAMVPPPDWEHNTPASSTTSSSDRVLYPHAVLTVDLLYLYTGTYSANDDRSLSTELGCVISDSMTESGKIDSPPRKKSKVWYQQVFNNEWLRDPDLKTWLKPDSNDKFSAVCNVCDCKLKNCNKSSLLSHKNSKKHMRNDTARKNSSELQNKKIEESVEDNCVVAEVQERETIYIRHPRKGMIIESSNITLPEGKIIKSPPVQKNSPVEYEIKWSPSSAASSPVEDQMQWKDSVSVINVFDDDQSSEKGSIIVKKEIQQNMETRRSAGKAFIHSTPTRLKTSVLPSGPASATPAGRPASATPAGGPASATPAGGPAAVPPAAATHVQLSMPPSVPFILGEDKDEKVKDFQKAVIKNRISAVKIPQFWYCDEIDMTVLVNLHDKLKNMAAVHGVHFSYMSVFIKAASMALSHFPILNSSVDENCENITYKTSHNIGIAMDTSKGLVVPNIKGVQGLTLLEVSAELNRLQNLESRGSLRVQDVTGGTITLYNIGSIGGTSAKVVIRPPEVALCTIGKIQTLPRFDAEGKVTKAHIMQISWSADHRIIEGTTVAQFSNLWKSFIENPATMIIYMK
ncbi:lipoamide acyltransferase component of branched-chain alpha-keto acid dehydrogenase complex, mitochondrial isoform X2 [Procambarus clarkii]|uniref:lipoamide acyltransferase component of branched-chain alpha-keto acid dehydrogenase complex, mitochondrial isoform X2 n=1 Tax=Procambarus clarkii TaxID=6728 RepID=UPI003742FCDE